MRKNNFINLEYNKKYKIRILDFDKFEGFQIRDKKEINNIYTVFCCHFCEEERINSRFEILDL